jgi:hypothetical protein
MSAPTTELAIEDFKRKLKECTFQAQCGRHFVQTTKLSSWMRNTVVVGGLPKTHTQRLVEYAYHKSHDWAPISHAKISRQGSDCCVLVFCILLDLGKGELIDTFAKKNLVDQQLPISLADLEEQLKSLDGGSELAKRFNQRQWRFNPARFGLDMEKEWTEHKIIPICRKEHLNEGGTAHVWQISVQEEFVEDDLKRYLQGDESACYEDPDYGKVCLGLF